MLAAYAEELQATSANCTEKPALRILRTGLSIVGSHPTLLEGWGR
jgi:hypothetical protein